MKKINKLAIKNFKAFQDEEIFEFKGRNVLVYGSNGSGKSSLFWALYTFLQSSIKSSDAEIEKYFDYDNPQSLLNIFLDENTSAKIEMTYIDEETQETHTNIISKETINTRENQTIQELNLASDFINYKLLHNFYNASHKDEVNLWSVFERDIFPFYTDGTIPILNKIKNKTKAIDGNKTRPAKDRKQEDLNTINTEIEALLTEVKITANEFLKKHFYENNDVIKIDLQFNKKFTLQNIDKNLWESGNDPIRHSELHIKLVVEQFMENIT
jgi:AAA15 family ATPase/GTPase